MDVRSPATTSAPTAPSTWAAQTRSGIFSRRLTFTPALERAFLQEQMEMYRPILRLSVSMIIVVYFAYFGFDELWFDRFTHDPAAALLFAVAAPAAILGIFSTWHTNPTVVRRSIVAATTINGAMLIAGYALELHWGKPTFTATALIIYLYYLYFMLGITHLQAMALATISMLAHVGSAAWGGMPLPQLYDHAFMMTVVIIVGGLSARMLELAYRRNYMNTLERRYLIERDALTGLLNVRAFFEQAEAALAQARIGNQPIAFVLIGIKRLGAYNAHLSHPAADAAMQALAAIITTQTQADDALAGSMGGEQFMVMLTGQSATQAAAWAAALTAEVQQRQIRHAGAPQGFVVALCAVVQAPARDWSSARAAALAADEELLRVRANAPAPVAMSAA